MKILINVATFTKGILLYDESRICESIFWNEAGAELKWVLPSLHMLLKKSGVSMEKDIEKITIVIGPGSFTGIRIAVSVINTLKYLYSHITLAALSTGELFSALDEEKHKNYLFQVFASDVFEFDKEGSFLGRKDMDALEKISTEQSAGMLMDMTLERFPDFHKIADTSSWNIEEIRNIEKKATEALDLVEPFYGKGANITTPKNPSVG